MKTNHYISKMKVRSSHTIKFLLLITAIISFSIPLKTNAQCVAYGACGGKGKTLYDPGAGGFYTSSTFLFNNGSNIIANYSGATVPSGSLFGINGNLSIGSSYWLATAAPTDGLLVQGRVGIGSNTSPSQNLQISSTTSATYSLFTNTGNSSGLLVGLDATGNSVFNQQSTSLPMQFWTNTAERMRITSAGFVGIGTSGPAGFLDISKSMNGTPSSIGQFLSLSTSTFTDNSTAGSGTATVMTFNSIAAPVLTASNSSVTTTNAYTLNIKGAPIGGANETLTNSTALNIDAAAVTSGVTSSYGLKANAQTGATNNYSAAFLGGNVGVGTSSPGSKLEIDGVDATSSNSALNINNSTPTSIFKVLDDGEAAINCTGSGVPGLVITHPAPIGVEFKSTTYTDYSGYIGISHPSQYGMRFEVKDNTDPTKDWIDGLLITSHAGGVSEKLAVGVGSVAPLALLHVWQDNASTSPAPANDADNNLLVGPFTVGGATNGAVMTSGEGNGYYFEDRGRGSDGSSAGNYFEWYANSGDAYLSTPSTGSILTVTSGGSVGIMNTTPDASAILDMNSTSQGVLIPRMSSTDRTSISSPATGLMVYDNTFSSFYYYDGSAWTKIASGSSSNDWTTTGSDIYNNNAGYVGIGTGGAPSSTLEVSGDLTVSGSGTITTSSDINDGGDMNVTGVLDVTSTSATSDLSGVKFKNDWIGLGISSQSVSTTAVDINGRDIDFGGGSPINTSDIRLKKEINLIENPLGKINALRGVTYFWNKDIPFNANNSDDRNIGVIAQELQKVLPELVKTNAKDGYLRVNYIGLIPVLIEGIKMQQTEIDSLKDAIPSPVNSAKIEELSAALEEEKAKNLDMESKLQQLSNKLDKLISCTGCNTNMQEENNSSLGELVPVLYQNQPNPFAEKTTIRYFLPDNSQDAVIQISSENGQILKSISLSQKGNATINVDAYQLKPGQYYYSLIVGNKLIDTKKMTVIGN